MRVREAFGVAFTNATTNQLCGHEFFTPSVLPGIGRDCFCRARIHARPAGGEAPGIRFPFDYF